MVGASDFVWVLSFPTEPGRVAPVRTDTARLFALDAIRWVGSNAGMNSIEKSYAALITELREIALLGSVSSVLGWDERTQLPTRGAEHRSNQMSLLARMIHQRFTAPKIDELLRAVEGSELVRDPASDAAVNV